MTLPQLLCTGNLHLLADSENLYSVFPWTQPLLHITSSKHFSLRYLIDSSSNHLPARNESTIIQPKKLKIHQFTKFLSSTSAKSHRCSDWDSWRSVSAKYHFPCSLAYSQDATLLIHTKGQMTILPKYCVLIFLAYKSFHFQILFWWKMNTHFDCTS